jgi:hypothetical protein
LASSQAGLIDITVSIARIELTRSLPICAASFKQARTFRAPSCHHIAGDVFDPKWERERRIAANAPSLSERWSPPKFPPVMSRIMAKRRTRCPVAPQARCLCYEASVPRSRLNRCGRKHVPSLPLSCLLAPVKRGIDHCGHPFLVRQTLRTKELDYSCHCRSRIAHQ